MAVSFCLGKLVQNRMPDQIHDLINIAHVGNQAQSDIVLGDVAQGGLGAGIGNTEPLRRCNDGGSRQNS